MSVSLSVARRFARSRPLAVSTAVMAACAMVIVGMFITLKAFTLSGGQIAERDLGRYTTSVDLAPAATIKPGDVSDATLTAGIATAARHAGARHAAVELSSFDIRPVMINRPKVIQYLETEWTAAPFPDRFSLITGRWPRRPGEVVLTDAAQAQFPSGRPLAVLGGAEHFRVVGTATDRYASYPEILAAPGTWAGLPDVTSRGFDVPAAIATLLWSGGGQHRVLAAVAAATSTRHAGDNQHTVVSRLSAGVSTRQYLVSHPEKSWLDIIPAGYTIPSLLLPLLAVLVIAALNHRRFRRAMATMVAVGMPARVAAAGIMAAVAVWTLAAGTVGAVLGFVLGLAARPICQHFLAQPVSPLPNLAGPLLRLLAATVVSCLLIGIVLRFSMPAGRPDPATATPGSRRGSLARVLRRGAALLAVVATGIEIRGMDSATKAMVLAATLATAVLLVTPEVVGATLNWVSRSEPRIRLARQQLLGERGRAAVGVAVLTASLGIPLGFITLLDTMITTGNAGVVAAVAPHQVAVDGVGGTMQPPSPAVARTIADRHVLPGHPITVHALANNQGPVMVEGTDIGEVYAVDTPEQVARLTARRITQHQAAILRHGGILTWDNQTGNSRVLVAHTHGRLVRTGPIPAATADCDPAWRQSSKGILLTSTAKVLKLPLITGATVYTGVSDAQAIAAQRAVADAGLNPDQVQRYESPEPIYVPTALFAAAIGLAMLVLVTTLAVARTQVATLRDYLGRLIAIGLTRRWARHVLLVETAFTVGLAIVLAAAIALPPVALAAWRVPHFVLSIPWGWLGLVTVGFCLAALAATLISSRRLRATDRTAV